MKGPNAQACVGPGEAVAQRGGAAAIGLIDRMGLDRWEGGGLKWVWGGGQGGRGLKTRRGLNIWDGLKY